MADNKLSAQVTIDTKQATAALSGLNKSVKGSAEVLNKLKPAAASGGAALTSLSRIAQDAPFGFIAIQNNVTEAVASFGQLKQSTGSTGAALRALGASMLGPGGLLLGFSLITSAVTALIQKYGSLGNAYDALLGKTVPLTEEQKEFAEQSNKSAVGLEKQKINIEQLVAVAKGDVGTKAQQVAALKELNKLIPDNIGFLNEQNIKTEAGTKILQAYTQQLINAAEAELLAGKAAELRVKLRDLGKTLDSAVTKELQKASKAQQQLGAGSSVAGALSGVNAITKAVNVNRDAVINGTKQFQDYVSTANELADLTTRLKELAPSVVPIVDVKPDGEKLVKTIKRVLLEADFELPLNKVTLPKSATDKVEIPASLSFEPQKQDTFDVAKSAIENFATQLQSEASKINVDLSGALSKPIAKELKGIKALIDSFEAQGLTADSFIVNEAVIKAQERLKAIGDAFSTLQTNIRAILASFTLDAFAGIGEVIGEGLANGAEGIKKAAAGLGSLIGNLFVSLGKEMIKASSVMIALQAALKTLQGPAFFFAVLILLPSCIIGLKASQ